MLVDLISLTGGDVNLDGVFFEPAPGTAPQGPVWMPCC